MTHHPSTIETELRAVLARQRPAEGAPAALRARVDDIPERVRLDNPLLALLRRAAVPLAAVGVASAAVVLASIGLTRAPVTGLPPAGGPTTVTFDPTLEGFGLVTSIVPTLLVGQWMLVGIAVAMVLRLSLGAGRHTRRSKLVASLLVVLTIVIAPTTRLPFLDDLGLQPGNVRAVLAGYALDEPPDEPFQEFDRYYQTAGPGESISIMFSIENAGPVPVRVEGVVVHPDSLAHVQARWTAVWLPAIGTSADVVPPLEETRPFEPRALAPGEELQLYLVGRAGPCAFGPGFAADSGVAGWTMLGPTIEVAYSIAGLVGTATIDMDQAFLEPRRNNCEPA